MDPLVDLNDVQRLIEIVQRHALDGLTVCEGDIEVSLLSEPGAGEDAAHAAAAPVGQTAAADEPSNYYQLKSPITGVFYRSAGPNDPPFVHDGDVVDEGETVCLIEAMKIFNEITAGVHGKLVRVAVANEQLVVTGEVLMEFEPLDGSEG